MTNKTSYTSGFIAIFITMLIWVGFVLSVRMIGASPLTTADVALLRFGIPTLLLLPFLPRRWTALSAVKPIHALMILIGSGLPFFFTASLGASTTSAAYVGALLPGVAPIFVALFGYIFDDQKLSAWKMLSLMLIGLGALTLLWSDLRYLRSEVLAGSAILLGASALWAIYTLGLRRAGVDAVGCAILLSLPSFVLLTILVIGGVLPSNLGSFDFNDALPFILVQGVGVGVIASVSYGYAIRTIGANKSAVIGSLTPAGASLLAVPLLEEILEFNTIIGVALLTIGVCCANLQPPAWLRKMRLSV